MFAITIAQTHYNIMKKITLILFFVLPMITFGQDNSQKIKTYLTKNMVTLGLTQNDISDIKIQSQTTGSGTGITTSYVAQRVAQTEVHGTQSIFLSKNGSIINAEVYFLANASSRTNAVQPGMTASQSLAALYGNLQITGANFSVLETASSKNLTFSDGLQHDPITAKLVYHITEDRNLVLAWKFQFYSPIDKNLYDVRVDANNGNILAKDNLTVNCSFEKPTTTAASAFNFNKSFYSNTASSAVETNAGSYRVIPYNFVSPDHSPFQLITNPDNAIASPYGWHDINGVAGAEYTYTRGNNVYAQEDADGNNGNGASPDGGATLNFDFPYGGTSVQPATYLPAATTNLFYMNNIMHDVWYQYGFNEASANFQKNNYGNGGITTFLGDPVNADAQDGSTASAPSLNNANFSTPQDGSSPRMQMFLWNVIPSPVKIITPAAIAGPLPIADNVFNPGHVDLPLEPAMIQTELVLFDDGSPDVGQTDNADACSPAINAAALAGKIALIRRSTAVDLGGTPCPFVEKVKNAQNAGAVAVIIVNNVGGNVLIGMSGADATITIPAVAVTQDAGYDLIARVKAGENVVVKLQRTSYVNSDGDFDNGIIGHEYGHGISNRLIGGGTSGCMNNYEQMGEGWSDWFSLMMQIKTGDTGEMPRAIATFAVSEAVNGGGIRTYPYSTDLAINPITMSHSIVPFDANGAYRYSVGETWTSVLWDLTWAYVNKYGFDPNIYSGTGGNNKVMRLVLDALKLQACNTSSIISGRDKLIAADQATTGGADYCLITEVFTRRGMGLNASSGSANITTDQVEDFTPFPPGPNCTLATTTFEQKDMFRVYPNPSNGIFNVRIAEYVGKVNFQVTDINGRVVYQTSTNDFALEKSLDLNSLQSGLYLLKIATSEATHVQKIIKK